MKCTSSVIICTRNRPDDLQKCLASLSKQIMQPNQLIIVDSSDTSFAVDDYTPVKFSTSGVYKGASVAHELSERTKELFSVYMVAAGEDTPQLVYVHTKPGLTHQRNIGIAHAIGDVLYFFDDDVILQHDYLAQMQRVFSRNPKFGGGMGTIENMQPYVADKYRLLRKIFLLPRDYDSGQFTASGMPTHAYGTKKFKPVQVLGGCCMAFTKKALQKHSFDETFGGYAYMEDVDISWRVSQDWPLFYNPKAKLQHHNSPINRDAMVANRAMFMRNYRYLFFKNVYPHDHLKLLLHWWSITGLFLEAVLVRDIKSLQGYWQALKKC